MAGTKNLFNSSVEEMIREVIRLRHGVRVDPDYIDVSYDTVTAQQLSVTLTPTQRNGQYFHGEAHLVLDKVDLANHRPVEIWYSGIYPITFERLKTAMSNSYGLIIRSGEWTVTQQSTTMVVDEDMVLEQSIANDATFTLRPSTEHPIIQPSYSLFVRITNRDSMSLRVGGQTQSRPGVPQTLTLEVQGGTAPYTVDPSALITQTGDDSISWVMDREGSADLTLGVTDVHGLRGETVVHLQAVPAALIVAPKVIELTAGQPLSHNMEVTGGVPPYRIDHVENAIPMIGLLGGVTLGGRSDLGERTAVVTVVDSLGERASSPFSVKGVARSDNLLAHNLGLSFVPEESLPGTHNALSLVLTASTGVGARGQTLLRLGNQRNGFNIYHSWAGEGAITVEYYARGQVYVVDAPAAGLNDLPKKVAVTVGDGYLTIYYGNGTQVSVPTPQQSVIIDNARTDGQYLHGLAVYGRRIYGDEFNWINH